MTVRHIDDPPSLRSVLPGLLILAAIWVCSVAAYAGWLLLVSHWQAGHIVEGQRRVIAEVGGRFTLDENDYYIRELDLSDARVGDDWVRKYFDYWEFRPIRVVKVKCGQLSAACVNELRAQQIDVVELDETPEFPALNPLETSQPTGRP